MRQVVLDTETTGLDPAQGHRVIEIGCVEIINRKQTKRHYHCYLNPDRDIDAGAMEVHGITPAFLADKPRFYQVEAEFLDFIAGAELIIHNAPFDMGFLNAELKRSDSSRASLDGFCNVLDSLVLARQKHPGQRNSLDALCKRYGVDNTQRELHGALLDAEILADVYLVMTSGQRNLLLREEENSEQEVENRRLCNVLDSLVLARQKHPGQRNSLDALCKRYGVDNTQRELHGALLDAEILADVYLVMTSGQRNLLLREEENSEQEVENRRLRTSKKRPALEVVKASASELQLHQDRLTEIDSESANGALWLSLNTN